MIKGWVRKHSILEDESEFYAVDVHPYIHVHQTSPDAIEGEAVVLTRSLNNNMKPIDGYLVAYLPAHLIGKRVKYCIWIEEG